MTFVHVGILLVGGLLAMAGLIISKKPEAKELYNKLLPYQAGIGVAMISLGVLNMITTPTLLDSFDMMGKALLTGLIVLLSMVCEVLVGFLLGFGLIAKWIPGETPAEEKAAEVQQKLIKFQTPLGAVSIGTGVMLLLLRFGVI